MHFGFNAKLTCLAALFGAGLAVATHAMAKEEDIGDDGYNKTYNDPSKSFKSRMKESRETPTVTLDNSKGGFFLGINGNFGPVYDAEPESSSGMGVGFGVEPGFAIQNSSWSRLEFSIQVAYQSFNWKNGKDVDSSMTPMVFMPTIGFGTSLGDDLFGIFKLGFGMSTGQMTQKYTSDVMKEAAQTVTGSSSPKTDSKTGFVFAANYDVEYGHDKVQFNGGIGVTHYQYAFSKLGNASWSDGNVNLNNVNVHGGIRFAF